MRTKQRPVFPYGPFKNLQKTNNMYKKNQPDKTTLVVNEAYIGETIEQKIFRIINNREPISDGAPLIYQERKDGVQPEYDIRTDRMEVALEAFDTAAKSYKARREERHKPKDDGKTPTEPSPVGDVKPT